MNIKLAANASHRLYLVGREIVSGVFEYLVKRLADLESTVVFYSIGIDWEFCDLAVEILSLAALE